MQIVIDIPQKLYKELTTVTVTHAGEVFAQKLIRYIKNGTPLPKGHGRLIDVDALIHKQTHHGDWGTVFELVDNNNLKCAPTIIEADKEKDE